MDALIVVVEPGRRAAGTASVIQKLAGDIGIRNVFVVGCKVASDVHREFIEKSSDGLKVIGHIPYDEDILKSDLEGTVAYDVSSSLREEAAKIRKAIESAVGVESDV
jgi:CO dehydrogenase maturation factor